MKREITMFSIAFFQLMHECLDSSDGLIQSLSDVNLDFYRRNYSCTYQFVAEINCFAASTNLVQYKQMCF